jgi:cell division protein FtsL
MNRRVAPSRPPSRIAAFGLGLAIVTIGFATLMTRLEVTQEGYRLSELQSEIGRQEELSRRLRVQTAELGSHQRLYQLAAKYHLAPPQRGQVVVVR